MPASSPQPVAPNRPVAPSGPDAAPSTCDNCEAPLTGAYCADCGQRAAGRVVALIAAYGIILAGAVVLLIMTTVVLM